MEDTSIPGSPRSAVSDEDVSQTNLQGKNDVILEFHVDDTIGANEEDSLMEMSFHIPSFNTQFAGDENHPSAQVFCDRIISMVDVGAGGEDVVVTFDVLQSLHQEDDTVLSYTCHSCDFKDRLMISKSSTAAWFAYFYFLSLISRIPLSLLVLIPLFGRDKLCTLTW